MIATILLISNGVNDNLKKKKQYRMLEQRKISGDKLINVVQF